jgi:hypothetical protein
LWTTSARRLGGKFRSPLIAVAYRRLQFSAENCVSILFGGAVNCAKPGGRVRGGLPGGFNYGGEFEEIESHKASFHQLMSRLYQVHLYNRIVVAWQKYFTRPMLCGMNTPMITTKLSEVIAKRGVSLYWVSKNTSIPYVSLWALSQKEKKNTPESIHLSVLGKLCNASRMIYCTTA